MKHFLIFTTIILSIFILGCVQEQKAEEVKVGVLVPETGKFSTAGVAMKNAAELAAKHLNEEKILKRYKIVLVYADCGDNPEKTKSAFAYLVSQGVAAVVGAYSSPQALAAADAAGSSKVVYIASVASTNQLEKKVSDGNKYVFRISYNTTYWGTLAAEFLELAKPEAYFFVGYDPLKTFNQGMLAAVKKRCGIKLKGEVYYKSLSVAPEDYKNAAEKAAKSVGEKDVLILGDPGKVSVDFLKEYRGKGGKGIIYSVGGVLALPQILKKLDADYTVFQAAALEETQKTKFTKKYFEDYRRTYGEDANNYAGILTYDAILVLTQALEKGGKEKLVETLEHGEFVGAAGVYKFNEKHQALWGSEKLKGVIAEYVDGVKILYPDEFATSEVIWPG